MRFTEERRSEDVEEGGLGLAAQPARELRAVQARALRELAHRLAGEESAGERAGGAQVALVAEVLLHLLGERKAAGLGDGHEVAPEEAAIALLPAGHLVELVA